MVGLVTALDERIRYAYDTVAFKLVALNQLVNVILFRCIHRSPDMAADMRSVAVSLDL